MREAKKNVFILLNIIFSVLYTAAFFVGATCFFKLLVTDDGAGSIICGILVTAITILIQTLLEKILFNEKEEKVVLPSDAIPLPTEEGDPVFVRIELLNKETLSYEIAELEMIEEEKNEKE